MINSRFCREMILLVAYISTYLCAPLVFTFTPFGICDQAWVYLLEFLSTVIFILDIFVKFFKGIDNKENKQVILEHKKIVRFVILR